MAATGNRAVRGQADITATVGALDELRRAASLEAYLRRGRDHKCLIPDVPRRHGDCRP